MKTQPKKKMTILGIETSCDETAAAIIQEKNGSLKLLSSIISSQVKLHAKWGGVVPNLAAREHMKNIIPVIEKSFYEAGIKPGSVDLIAVTQGPGLIPALLIGVNSAKVLSYLWNTPLIGIHHIEGHIYANFIGKNVKNIQFPVLCLVVSGGHTQLILMNRPFDYRIIGQTLDDAAGEAFDKVARILGLGYPGGPIISKLAGKVKNDSYKKLREKLPRPMFNSKNYDFSFSGLKTAVLYLTKRNKKMLGDKKYVEELCYEFQKSVIDVLVSKTIRAAKEFNPRTIMLAGGVSANLELRRTLENSTVEQLKNISYIAPDIEHSVDNAAMIAVAAYYRLKAKKGGGKKSNWKILEAEADLELK